MAFSLWLLGIMYKLLTTVCNGKDDLSSRAAAAAVAEGDSDDNVSNSVAPTIALTCVTATDMDGHGACGAEGARPAVNHQDRQEVHILLMAVEAWPLGLDASRVVWVGSVKMYQGVRVIKTKVKQGYELA